MSHEGLTSQTLHRIAHILRKLHIPFAISDQVIFLPEQGSENFHRLLYRKIIKGSTCTSHGPILSTQNGYNDRSVALNAELNSVGLATSFAVTKVKTWPHKHFFSDSNQPRSKKIGHNISREWHRNKAKGFQGIRKRNIKVCLLLQKKLKTNGNNQVKSTCSAMPPRYSHGNIFNLHSIF